MIGLLSMLMPAFAQGLENCKLLCAPELKIEPTFTIENLFRPPRIDVLDNGRVVESGRAARETVFELILALDIPTSIPRLGLTFEAIFIPFGETDTHPFTGAPAAHLGRSSIRDNEIEIEAELNIDVVDSDRTGGWVESHVDIVDKISPAERPGDASLHTHKLNFELDTAFFVFNWLSGDHWLRNVEVEVSLDYVATGLPRRGDILGDERFLDDASPWSISFVFVFPLAPLAP
jgi:hypothetical protein